jgi:hypothetical protein
VDSETYASPLGNFVPNLLEHTDLPALAKAASPRRIVLAGAVDALGGKLSVAEVHREYGDVSNVEVRPDGLWSAAAILV